MGYLSFQIIFFLLLAALLGFIIGWLLRGSRFQTELQDLDARWRTKLGEVEGERDRYVAELTQANDAKSKLEAELKRLSETHESSLEKLRREHQTKIASFADTEKTMAGLKSDLAAKNDEVGRVQADLTKVQQSEGNAARLGKELAAASERAAKLEGSLKDSQNANASCKSEVDRLKAEIAELKRSGGAAAGTASSGGALGLMSGGLSSTGPSGGAGSGGTGGPTGGAGAGGSSDPSYTQRAASPSHLADTSGGNFSGSTDSTGQTSGGWSVRDSDKDDNAAAGDDEEGQQPAALTTARDGKADDLKLISGVGPKLEKTLNGLGIFHFWQIAEFTPDNVAWVDRHLRFKGRIEREKWISQAKVLAAGQETEFSKRQ